MKNGIPDGKKWIVFLAVGIAAALLLRRSAPSLAAGILWIVGIAFALLILLVVVVIIAAFSGTKKESQSVKSHTAQLLAEGSAQVMKLRQQERMIQKPEIRAQNSAVCDTASKILQVLREKPESISNARRFLNYYLPTQSVILEKYISIERSGVPNEELAGKVLNHLQDIDLAMKKLHDSLFEGDILDLSVEMEVMTAMCRQDGLLEEDEIPVQTEEKQVALRL